MLFSIQFSAKVMKSTWSLNSYYGGEPKIFDRFYIFLRHWRMHLVVTKISGGGKHEIPGGSSWYPKGSFERHFNRILKSCFQRYLSEKFVAKALIKFWFLTPGTSIKFQHNHDAHFEGVSFICVPHLIIIGLSEVRAAN